VVRRTKVTDNNIIDMEYTLQDIIDVVQYGFDYRENAMHDGVSVPDGNVLQWLMGKKNLSKLPEEFIKFKEEKRIK
jgi:hypothetical protein